RLRILDKLIEHGTDDERGLYLGEMATVYEEANEPRVAAETLERIVAADPLDEGALERLRGLYKASGATEKLAEVLGRLAGLCVDPDEKKALVTEQARIIEEELGDKSAAIAAHEALLSEFPRYVPSLDAIARLHRSLGNHTAALGALESL